MIATESVPPLSLRVSVALYVRQEEPRSRESSVFISF